MYDLELKFETKIFVNALSKASADMFKSLGDVCLKIGSECSMEHKMTITDVDKIPSADAIDKMREILHSQYKQSLESSDKFNIDVIDTSFVGFTKIIEKE